MTPANIAFVSRLEAEATGPELAREATAARVAQAEDKDFKAWLTEVTG